MLENFRLRVFREVANQASFRRAAEVLYITQPAVTQQIKALEEELGSRLFDRSGGKVRLTAAGETLLRRAGEAEATLNRAIEEIGSLEGEVRGSLRIAASTTIAQYVLPRLLAEFARQHQGDGSDSGGAIFPQSIRFGIQRDFWLHTSSICHAKAHRAVSKSPVDVQRPVEQNRGGMRICEPITPQQSVPQSCGRNSR